MTDEEIMKDGRVRLAVQKGEYSRSISLFLQLKFPGKTLGELAELPNSDISNAQICIDNAFHAKWTREKALAQEMR